jgi:predicted O-linked N-acetylglucosamine transferase (SPINDLY family)
MPQADHLARHRSADLFLDTFNYNAHTAASDALWAGLPVVTKAGHGFPARVAGSILSTLGIPELITDGESAYEALAFNLAIDPVRLTAIKAKIAEKIQVSPMFKTNLFARNLEDALDRVFASYMAN